MSHQGFAYLQDHALGLLRERFHRHEMHARAPRRLADGFGVVPVVLAAFDVRFDVLRRNETRLVAERGQFASPVVGTAARFQDDLRGRELPEERIHLPATQIGPKHRMIPLVDAVQGEYGLGRVDGNALILGHGRLRSWLFTAPILAHDAVGPSTPTSAVKYSIETGAC